jgi:predicted amidophosphoribosyltransferase
MKKQTCPSCERRRPWWERWCGNCGKKLPITESKP